MFAIWAAGSENSSAVLAGLWLVENDVILLAWSPAPPQPAEPSAAASAAEDATSCPVRLLQLRIRLATLICVLMASS
jgi:hypothetical protein